MNRAAVRIYINKMSLLKVCICLCGSVCVPCFLIGVHSCKHVMMYVLDCLLEMCIRMFGWRCLHVRWRCLHAFAFVCACVCVWVHKCENVWRCLYKCVCFYVWMCLSVCVWRCLHNVFKCMNLYMYQHAFYYISIYVYVCLCLYMCFLFSIHVYVCVCVCVHYVHVGCVGACMTSILTFGLVYFIICSPS